MKTKRIKFVLYSLLAFILLWSAASAIYFRPVAGIPTQAPAKGFLAPDFTLTTLEGDRFTLSEHFGKPIILTLWASWCTPCQAEMPTFNEVFESYPPGEVMIVGVNVTLQDDPLAVRQFVDEHALSFPIVLDTRGSVANSYRLRGLPMTFFIDPQGVIQQVQVGGPIPGATVRSFFAETLKETTP